MKTPHWHCTSLELQHDLEGVCVTPSESTSFPHRAPAVRFAEIASDASHLVVVVAPDGCATFYHCHTEL